jgi:hypothetical protein
MRPTYAILPPTPKGNFPFSIPAMLAKLIVLLAWILSAQSVPRYEIYRAPSPIMVDGKLDDSAWQAAPPVGDFHFKGWKSGEKERTVARILWDNANLYVGYFWHDRHISAFITERHGPVSRDDCVEIFISPNPTKIRNYYTFEIDAIGTMLNGIVNLASG